MTPAIQPCNALSTTIGAVQSTWFTNLAGIDIACLCAAAFTFERFQAALSVVLAYAAYLPSASCFVLLPLLSQVSCPMSCEVSYVWTQK